MTNALQEINDSGLHKSMSNHIKQLQGPILILGASGFVGANLFRRILSDRNDVFGTATHLPTWRLEGLSKENVHTADLLVDSNLDALLEQVKPRTIFNCIAYGAYSFEQDSQLIYQTNFNLTAKILSRLSADNLSFYVHSGSSSEYGANASGPDEYDFLKPNSDYSVSKTACANLIYYYGQKKRIPCANLRLYSVYGPLEDSSRLIPALISKGIDGEYPEFVDPDISRDFIYVDDVCEAFILTALNLTEENYGVSLNIGSGCKTTIGDVAKAAKSLFNLTSEPIFSMPSRLWDVADWYANVKRAEEMIGWRSRTSFETGLAKSVDWFRTLENRDRYFLSSKKFGLDTKFSVTAIVACYRDGQAIPVMYRRLKETFEKLKIEYEIIFVNDDSPDNSEEAIREISRQDRRVIGISHSRNFGSQAAFKSGMGISTKNACVLLDGDLQDPPELIEKFVEEWRQGYDVVYGRRVKREATFLMQIAYKLFYRIFDKFSYLKIPHDAGDFALMDKQVVQSMMQFPERDLFMRGVRAFVGYKQTGVDYVRPERMFGVTTNNLAKNIGWAKKGILSFSNTPLNILSYAGTALLLLSTLAGFSQVLARIFFPHSAPQGFTIVVITVLFFGSVNLFAIGIVGEYIAKIFEEVKQRPLFIRRNIIRNGEVRSAADIGNVPK